MHPRIVNKFTLECTSKIRRYWQSRNFSQELQTGKKCGNIGEWMHGNKKGSGIDARKVDRMLTYRACQVYEVNIKSPR